MLGSEFLRQLSENSNFEVVALDKDEADICKRDELEVLFKKERPDFVLNCAAFTDVDGCESYRNLAFEVNASAVGEIAGFCEKNDTILIHFSTDYVFDGENIDGYNENSVPTPINVYGESKADGERLIVESGCKHYIVRTSWLFGPNGKNFVDTMLKLASERDELKVVDDQIGAPTYSVDLVRAVIANFIEKSSEFGVYHLTNSGKCSWYEFAKEIFELKEIDVKLSPVTTEEFVRPAKRPKCSILKNMKIGELRQWNLALKDYLS